MAANPLGCGGGDAASSKKMLGAERLSGLHVAGARQRTEEARRRRCRGLDALQTPCARPDELIRGDDLCGKCGGVLPVRGGTPRDVLLSLPG